MSAAAVLVLLLLAGWVLVGPARPLGRREPAHPPGRRPGPITALRRGLRNRRRRRERASAEVGRLLVEVAARLRAGADLSSAWQRALPSPSPPWTGPLLDAVGLASGTGAARGGAARAAVASAEVTAAVAACRLARRTGAPLAEVIDVVVAGIVEATEADELRRTALAGPRATARLLAWLPVGGIVLGMTLGADPLAVLLGGGAGGLCLVAGGALFVAGRHWVRALVAEAERAGS